MNKKPMALSLRSLVLLTTLASVAAHAEIYKRVDSNGNVYYSDEASDGAKKIEVPPITTIS